MVPKLHFAGQELPLQDEVVRLGHVLTYDFLDEKDAVAKCKDMIRKDNSLLRTVSGHPYIIVSCSLPITVSECSLELVY